MHTRINISKKSRSAFLKSEPQDGCSQRLLEVLNSCRILSVILLHRKLYTIRVLGLLLEEYKQKLQIRWQSLTKGDFWLKDAAGHGWLALFLGHV